MNKKTFTVGDIAKMPEAQALNLSSERISAYIRKSMNLPLYRNRYELSHFQALRVIQHFAKSKKLRYLSGKRN